jgi:quercetin dioxygenase-like cupin family protein
MQRSDWKALRCIITGIRVPQIAEAFMSLHHAESGEIVKLALGNELSSSQTSALVKTSELEVIRLVLPAGKQIPVHQAPGPITVQCLEGRISLTSHEKRQEVATGEFLYLAGNEPHALEGLIDASVLVTILLKPR